MSFSAHCESTLRRLQFHQRFDVARDARREENHFARRMNFATIEDFRAPYGNAREAIHSLRRCRYLSE